PADGVNGLRRLADPLMGQIKAAMPAFLAKNAEQMVRCLMTECQKTPALLDCAPKSLFGGVIQAAQLGLTLGGPMGQAYLIPFKGQAQLVVGYKGYIALAHRSGRVRRITPRVVREGDVFEVLYGNGQRLVHRPDVMAAGGSLGKPVGYYAVIELDNGGEDFEFRTVAEMEAHRDRYALSKNGPWKTNFDEMALKTCIRILAKRMPLSDEWATAAGLDDLAEREEPQGLSQVFHGAVAIEADPAADLRDRLDQAKRGDVEVDADGVPIGPPADAGKN